MSIIELIERRANRAHAEAHGLTLIEDLSPAEQKAIHDDMEAKARYVRTAAGVARFKRPIGAIILPRGLGSLDRIRIKDPVFKGFDLVEDRKGNLYDVGKDDSTGKYVALKHNTWDDQIKPADSLDDALAALNEKLGGGTNSDREEGEKPAPEAKKPAPKKAPGKESSGDSTPQSDAPSKSNTSTAEIVDGKFVITTPDGKKHTRTATGKKPYTHALIRKNKEGSGSDSYFVSFATDEGKVRRESRIGAADRAHNEIIELPTSGDDAPSAPEPKKAPERTKQESADIQRRLKGAQDALDKFEKIKNDPYAQSSDYSEYNRNGKPRFAINGDFEQADMWLRNRDLLGKFTPEEREQAEKLRQRMRDAAAEIEKDPSIMKASKSRAKERAEALPDVTDEQIADARKKYRAVRSLSDAQMRSFLMLNEEGRKGYIDAFRQHRDPARAHQAGIFSQRQSRGQDTTKGGTMGGQGSKERDAFIESHPKLKGVNDYHKPKLRDLSEKNFRAYVDAVEGGKSPDSIGAIMSRVDPGASWNPTTEKWSGQNSKGRPTSPTPTGDTSASDAADAAARDRVQKMRDEERSKGRTNPFTSSLTESQKASVDNLTPGQYAKYMNQRDAGHQHYRALAEANGQADTDRARLKKIQGTRVTGTPDEKVKKFEDLMKALDHFDKASQSDLGPESRKVRSRIAERRAEALKAQGDAAREKARQENEARERQLAEDRDTMKMHETANYARRPFVRAENDFTGTANMIDNGKLKTKRQAENAIKNLEANIAKREAMMADKTRLDELLARDVEARQRHLRNDKARLEKARAKVSAMPADREPEAYVPPSQRSESAPKQSHVGTFGVPITDQRGVAREIASITENAKNASRIRTESTARSRIKDIDKSIEVLKKLQDDKDSPMTARQRRDADTAIKYVQDVKAGLAKRFGDSAPKGTGRFAPKEIPSTPSRTYDERPGDPGDASFRRGASRLRQAGIEDFQPNDARRLDDMTASEQNAAIDRLKAGESIADVLPGTTERQMTTAEKRIHDDTIKTHDKAQTAARNLSQGPDVEVNLRRYTAARDGLDRAIREHETIRKTGYGTSPETERRYADSRALRDILDARLKGFREQRAQEQADLKREQEAERQRAQAEQAAADERRDAERRERFRAETESVETQEALRRKYNQNHDSHQGRMYPGIRGHARGEIQRAQDLNKKGESLQPVLEEMANIRRGAEAIMASDSYWVGQKQRDEAADAIALLDQAMPYIEKLERERRDADDYVPTAGDRAEEEAQRQALTRRAREEREARIRKDVEDAERREAEIRSRPIVSGGKYDRDALIRALVDDQEIPAVYGPDRPAAQRDFQSTVRTFKPTKEERMEAAVGNSARVANKVKAYDKSAQLLRDLYNVYDPDLQPGSSVGDAPIPDTPERARRSPRAPRGGSIDHRRDNTRAQRSADSILHEVQIGRFEEDNNASFGRGRSAEAVRGDFVRGSRSRLDSAQDALDRINPENLTPAERDERSKTLADMEKARRILDRVEAGDSRSTLRREVLKDESGNLPFREVFQDVGGAIGQAQSVEDLDKAERALNDLAKLPDARPAVIDNARAILDQKRREMAPAPTLERVKGADSTVSLAKTQAQKARRARTEKSARDHINVLNGSERDLNRTLERSGDRMPADQRAEVEQALQEVRAARAKAEENIPLNQRTHLRPSDLPALRDETRMFGTRGRQDPELTNAEDLHEALPSKSTGRYMEYELDVDALDQMVTDGTAPSVPELNRAIRAMEADEKRSDGDEHSEALKDLKRARDYIKERTDRERAEFEATNTSLFGDDLSIPEPAPAMTDRERRRAERERLAEQGRRINEFLDRERSNNPAPPAEETSRPVAPSRDEISALKDRAERALRPFNRYGNRTATAQERTELRRVRNALIKQLREYDAAGGGAGRMGIEIQLHQVRRALSN